MNLWRTAETHLYIIGFFCFSLSLSRNQKYYVTVADLQRTELAPVPFGDWLTRGHFEGETPEHRSNCWKADGTNGNGVRTVKVFKNELWTAVRTIFQP